MLKTLLLVSVALAMTSADLAAQNVTGVFARFDQWSIDSGHLANSEDRPGVAVGLVSAGAHGMLRAGVGWTPEGDVAPGWTTVKLEGGPHLVLARRVGVGVQANLTALDMKVDNRHAVMEKCQEGCVFEAPALEGGWGFMVGASLTGHLQPGDRLQLTGEYGRHRVMAGSNETEWLDRWSLGAQFRIR
jgi:hypothetical protein